jgi:hypothetical protein
MNEIICEPIELLEFELDAVAGGNPNNFTLTISAISSTVTTAITQAFSADSHAAAAIDVALDQSLNIS